MRRKNLPKVKDLGKNPTHLSMYHLVEDTKGSPFSPFFFRLLFFVFKNILLENPKTPPDSHSTRIKSRH